MKPQTPLLLFVCDLCGHDFLLWCDKGAEAEVMRSWKEHTDSLDGFFVCRGCCPSLHRAFARKESRRRRAPA